MSLRQRDGDYIPDGAGDFQRATGTEALLEQARFALCAHRGGFPLMPEVGSRLYLLERERASVREGLARAYAQEALNSLGLTVTQVKLTRGDPMLLELSLTYGEEDLNLEVTVE